jgi:flagellar biosynthesis/type III secretory pathway M-ring protein FliF/YscJ
MEIVTALVAGVLLAVVVAVISAPLRDARRPISDREQEQRAQDASQQSREDGYERAELEAARETKYREIRDAELDLRTGKLSREDYEAIDSGLRAEALELLDRLEALDGRSDASAESEKAKPELEG